MVLIIRDLEKSMSDLKETVVKRNQYKPPLRDKEWHGSNRESEYGQETKYIEEAVNDLQMTIDNLKDINSRNKNQTR